jgi:cytoskeletal protein CcmA (bactofilin family)
LRKTAQFEVTADQVISDELWLAADAVKLRGTAERALFLQTLNAELAGQFRRDVWALADTLQFSGQADQAVRVAARHSIQIAGRVAGGLVALGETIQIQKAARLGEDALLLGQDVIFEGAVSNRLTALGNKITLAGQVGGTARIIADEITLMPGTIIVGDLVYTSDKELFAGDGVTIGGKLIRQAKTNLGFSLPSLTLTQLLLLQFSLLLAALFVGLPFVALFPLFTTRAVAQLREHPNKCLLTGAIVLALLPMLGVMAAMTWIGLPLGALLLGAFAMLLYLSKLIVAIPLAGRVFARRAPAKPPVSALPVLTLGLFLLYFGAALPIVGFAVWLVTVLYGMGALVLALLGGEKGLRADAPPVPPPEPPPLNGFSP